MPRPNRPTPASRERNRVHAQKTRLRKKEHVQVLQVKAAELKEEQVRLKQSINEKSTATILVRLFAEGSIAGDACSDEDPRVEELLRRPLKEIPDTSQIPELPALILPGQHASKKMKASMLQLQQPLSTCSGSDVSLDGFDFELLGRDRSQCTPEVLDLIRRERNRMHAKRTRDRKRIFTEKLAELCREVEEENILLHLHLKKIDPDYKYEPPVSKSTPKSKAQPSYKCQPVVHADPDLSSVRWNPIVEPSMSKIIFDERMISSLLTEKDLHDMRDTATTEDDELPQPTKRQRFIQSLSVA